MRFMDELHGSIGERCTVADLRNDTTWEGTITRLDDDAEKVYVQRDNGGMYRVGIGDVTLHLDEDEANA